VRRTREKKDIGPPLLLVSELSLILFLFWALSVESGKQARTDHTVSRPDVSPSLSGVFVTNPTSVQEEPMQRQHAADDELHVEVHIDLCPNDVLHVTIGNICLHLCRKDFLQLAQAVQAAADQMTRTRATKENIH
jgi:hypothetical protein